MNRIIPGLVLLLAIGCGSPNEKEYKIHIQSLVADQPGPTEVIPSISDQGLWINTKWKERKSTVAKATLFDGSANPVWNQEFPNFFEGPEVSSSWSNGPFSDSISTTLRYYFNPNDKPGNWRFVFSFDNRVVIEHSFEVAAAPTDPNIYQDVGCYLPDGKIDLSNFYQLSINEAALLNDHTGVWGWESIKYEIQKRVAKCIAPTYSHNSIEEWENWFKKLSGKNISQSNPSVHERVKAVMPVFAEEFFFVNPDFVAWFSENMVPRPSVVQLNDWVFQDIYDRALKDIMRDRALTYLYYVSLPTEGLEAQVQYAEMTARNYINKEENRVMTRNDRVDIFRLLNEWHQLAATDWVSTNISKEVYGQAPFIFKPMDMGFWLRRGIDGSANELWMALREVLKQYDKDWYDQYIDPHWAP